MRSVNEKKLDRLVQEGKAENLEPLKTPKRGPTPEEKQLQAIKNLQESTAKSNQELLTLLVKELKKPITVTIDNPQDTGAPATELDIQFKRDAKTRELKSAHVKVVG